MDVHAPRMCAQYARAKRATSARGSSWPTAQHVVLLGLGPQGGTPAGSPPVRDFWQGTAGTDALADEWVRLRWVLIGAMTGHTARRCPQRSGVLSSHTSATASASWP
eukprot:1554799-Pleurochrysis_carterae.AAC.1